MAPQYAKDQPSGFTNRIERVAIIGATGHIGQVITESLVKTGKHTVTAITRKGSKGKVAEGAKVVPLDYDDTDALVAALKGHEMLILCLAVTAPPDTQDKLVKAAAAAGIKHIMPNAWGGELRDTPLARDMMMGERNMRDIKFVEDAGLTWTSLGCSFWYEYSLAVPICYGIDAKNKKVTLYGDGKVQVTTSTWEHCGRAVAAFLSLKRLPEDENDTSVTMAKWHNKPIFVSSFVISQRDMLDSVNRVQGTTDADWDITSEPADERYKRALGMLQGGDPTGFGMAMYARAFFPEDPANFKARVGSDNEILGLPKEELDEATARSLAMESPM